MADGIDLWGIRNCDTMKKARAWLDGHGVAYAFRDYREEGADPARLDAWVEKLGWEVVLNRQSTTFRALPEAEKQDLDAAGAKALMLREPTMIKRPILERGDGLLLVGFKPAVYETAFGRSD